MELEKVTAIVRTDRLEAVEKQLQGSAAFETAIATARCPLVLGAVEAPACRLVPVRVAGVR